MPVHSYLPKQPLTCTVGVPTLSLPLSYNLTVKTASKSVKVLTSILSNHTDTTHAHQILVLTYIPSHSVLKNTSHLAHATSQELITLLSSLSFLTPVSKVLTQPRFVSMLSTTTSSVSCPIWVVSLILTKFLIKYYVIRNLTSILTFPFILYFHTI